MVLFVPGMFLVAFLLVSVVLIGIQFAPEDGPDVLPFTLVSIPVWVFLPVGAVLTI